jgi:hypothetical protein
VRNVDLNGETEYIAIKIYHIGHHTERRKSKDKTRETYCSSI